MKALSVELAVCTWRQNAALLRSSTNVFGTAITLNVLPEARTHARTHTVHADGLLWLQLHTADRPAEN